MLMECPNIVVPPSNIQPKLEPFMVKQQEKQLKAQMPEVGETQLRNTLHDSSEDEAKFSMEKLCLEFLQCYKQRQDVTFGTKYLMEKFSVKQRRIYDLMNILEGCGVVKKISKGEYQWLGIQQAEILKFETQRGDSTSLRQIAARIKLLLHDTKESMMFVEIYDQIVEHNLCRSVSSSSIRRRIYECCKVLKILGLISKVGKQYRWLSPEERKAAPQTVEKRPRKIRLSGNENSLLNELIRRCKNEQDVERLVQKLRQRFLSSRQGVKNQ